MRSAAGVSLAIVVGWATAGCGRIGFASMVAGGEAAGAGDASPPPPVDACTLGPFGPIRELAEVDTAAEEDGPWLSGEVRTMLFASGRSGPSRLYLALQRAATSDPFGAPTEIALSSVGDLVDPFMSEDLLTLWFAGDNGDIGTSDIYVATRATAADPFGTPAPIGELNTGDGVGDVSLTTDQLTIVFTANAPAYGIYLAQRATVTSAFGTPQYLTDVSTEVQPCCADVSGDGGVIVYTGVLAAGDTRMILASTLSAGTFGVPSELDPGLDGSDNADPLLSNDRQVIVFSSTRTGGTGQGDIYIAERACL